MCTKTQNSIIILDRWLTSTYGTFVEINPNLIQAHRLERWRRCQQFTRDFIELSPRIEDGTKCCIADVRTHDGRSNMQKQEHFELLATITDIKTDARLARPTCPRIFCKRALNKVGSSWQCSNCMSTYSRPQWRFVKSSDCGIILLTLIPVSCSV